MPRLLEIKETIHKEDRDTKLAHITLYMLVQNKEWDIALPYERSLLQRWAQEQAEDKGYSHKEAPGIRLVRAYSWTMAAEPHWERDDIMILRFTNLVRPLHGGPNQPTMEDIIFEKLMGK